jgi:hypothetical protein
LFYLRKRVGKAVRLTESRRVREDDTAAAGEAAPAAPKKELAAAAT